MLRVLTWLWRQPGGRARYEPAHVRIWADMVRRNLTLPHTLGVVTDLDGDFGEGVEIIPLPRDFEDVRIPTWREGRPQCFRRLSLFRPDAADLFGGDRIVSMDLDVVVTASLDSLFTGGEDFRICRGTAASRSFNGSMYMIRAGSLPHVYAEFTPERAIAAGRRHVGSDQSWIARCLAGRVPTWGPADGVVAMQHRHLAQSPRLITYPGSIKPWDIAALGADRLVSQHYRGTRSGAGLILGYGETIWSDLDAALEGRSFEGVIASPEAAAHWPGRIVAIARDDAHAERLAAMHGFSDVVFCGRSGGQVDGADI